MKLSHILLVLCLTTTPYSQAQNPVLIVDNSGPKNAHEYALQTFKEWKEYMDARDARLTAKMAAKGLTLIPSDVHNSERYISSPFGGEIRTISIDENGNIILTNTTMEEAILLVVANEMNRELDNIKIWDADDAARDAAKKSVPPSTMKVGAASVRIEDQSLWAAYTLGDTNCATRKINLLNDSSEKKSTLLHEMMHVATNCNAAPALHRAITQMAPALLKLLQDNPEIVKYLTETDHTIPIRGVQVLDDGTLVSHLSVGVMQDDPTKPYVLREPVMHDVSHCLQGWHLEKWSDPPDLISIGPALQPLPAGYYPIPPYVAEIPKHPDRCVKDH